MRLLCLPCSSASLALLFFSIGTAYYINMHRQIICRYCKTQEMFDGFMRRRRLERPLLILLALARVQLWEPARAQAGLVYADGQSKVNIVFMEPGQVEAAPKGGRARPPQSSAMHSTIMTPHDEYRLHLNDPQFVAGVPEISDGPQPNGQGQAE